ncbi:nitronate monooxygenase [Thioclava sp. GXIMD2076]|uniref:NAD(P)H-dependent flavin oxidoreductase n=1 Tax=Thioclava sp. GXIMD2076 TaxID=3131931 RepID=UPI0030CD76C6
MPTTRHALSAARIGADAVILIGAEAAGHPGTELMGRFVQTAAALRALPVAVIMGGGIGHGSQILTALALGAAGRLVGTRMMAARESVLHPGLKQRVIDSDGSDTRIIHRIFNHHRRVMMNATVGRILEREEAGGSEFEAYRPLVSGPAAREAQNGLRHLGGPV